VVIPGTFYSIPANNSNNNNNKFCAVFNHNKQLHLLFCCVRICFAATATGW
jgi:hypothetical protein